MDTLNEIMEIDIYHQFILTKAKKKLKMWRKIRDLIRTITLNFDECDEKYIKIKFNSDDFRVTSK